MSRHAESKEAARPRRDNADTGEAKDLAPRNCGSPLPGFGDLRRRPLTSIGSGTVPLSRFLREKGKKEDELLSDLRGLVVTYFDVGTVVVVVVVVVLVLVLVLVLGFGFGIVLALELELEVVPGPMTGAKGTEDEEEEWLATRRLRKPAGR